MEFPIIDMKKLEGEERGSTMELIQDACENWGFFEVLNHGIPVELMDKIQKLFKEHYRQNMESNFKDFVGSKKLEEGEKELDQIDWESTFFLRHLPVSNLADMPLSEDYT